MHTGPLTGTPPTVATVAVSPTQATTPSSVAGTTTDGVLIEHSPARAFVAEVTRRDGTQEHATVWAADAETARNLLRAPDTVVRIVAPRLSTTGEGTR